MKKALQQEKIKNKVSVYQTNFDNDHSEKFKALITNIKHGTTVQIIRRVDEGNVKLRAEVI